MNSSRRLFFKLAGISALGTLFTRPTLNAFAAGTKSPVSSSISMHPSSTALKAKQWAMVIDTRQITTRKQLDEIVNACIKEHNIPQIPDKKHKIKWIWGTGYGYAFPDQHAKYGKEELEHKKFLVLCNHCENPACVRVCPTKATFKDSRNGITMMDMHRCIGCRFCMAACPYGSRSFNFVDPRPYIKEKNPQYPTRMKGVVEKCNYCSERLAVGKLPSCVEASQGTIAFGDLFDPKSNVRELIRTNYTIRRKQHLGTEPTVYYIV